MRSSQLSMNKITSPVKVGLFLPNDSPTAGGVFSYQQTIFTEVLKRIKNPVNPDIQYVIISFDSRHTRNWGLTDADVLNVNHPTATEKIQQTAHYFLVRLISPWRKTQWNRRIYENKITQHFKGKVDLVWFLGPYIYTDQLPFIVPIWDLQHRLQPFFSEVSKSGEWEARQNYYSNISMKAFINLVGTNRGAKELNQFFGVDHERIVVNPFPCPPPVGIKDSLTQENLNKYGIKAGQYLFYPAQFWSHKNHLGLLHAFNHLVRSGSELQLVLTGSDKGIFNEIQSLISDLKLENSVFNLGFVSRELIGSLYSNAFALVYPSFFGPDNIPPLEAMSYGTPAIVADVRGSIEQYGDAVLRFNPNKPMEIAECVEQLSKNPGLRNNLIHLGFELIKNLSPSKYVNRVEHEISRQMIALKCANL